MTQIKQINTDFLSVKILCHPCHLCAKKTFLKTKTISYQKNIIFAPLKQKAFLTNKKDEDEKGINSICGR